MADYISTLTGQQMDDALEQMNERLPEQWTTGQIDGVDVPSDNPRYHNNAKYYSDISEKGIKITDTVATSDDLPSSAEIGTAYGVGTMKPYDIWIKGSNGWVNYGKFFDGIIIETTAPTEDNPKGFRFVHLATEPTVKYNGWIYLIDEA